MARNRLGTRRVLSGPPLSWPFGKDGPLVIGFGEIVALAPGVIKDYSSVDIQAGGILQITSQTGTPVILGCSGNFNLDGEIDFNQNPFDGTFSNTAPDGFLISYTVAVAEGGEGGFCFGAGALVGQPAFGNGGGGAGITSGQDAILTHPGDGGDVYDSGSMFPGGLGASDINNPDGFNGPDSNSVVGDSVGGGGGGGYRGYNGGALYIKVKGTCSGSGIIDVEGFGGGLGGGGGAGNGNGLIGTSAYGGGGGGGGGGGSGGKIVIKYHVNAPTWVLTTNGAFGGSGGPGGDATGGDVDNDPGLQGTDGNTGNSGSSSVTRF